MNAGERLSQCLHCTWYGDELGAIGSFKLASGYRLSSVLSFVDDEDGVWMNGVSEDCDEL